jgi:hypothetical protein
MSMSGSYSSRSSMVHLLAGEVRGVGKALHDLAPEVAVGHGVAHRDHGQPPAAQDFADLARGLGLAAARAHGADRDHRALGAQHGVLGADEQEIRAERLDQGGLVHQLHVGHVGVGEDHQVGRVRADERGQLGFGPDGDALGVARPGQLRRVDASADAADLGRGEGGYAVRGYS